VLAAWCASALSAADRFPPPRLPVTIHWSIDLRAGATGSPVNDGERIYLALKTAHVVAFAPSDGHEIWRIAKDVTATMAAADGALFMPLADAVEAARGKDGASLWVAPQIKAVAPLVVSGKILLVATETEIVALNTADGQVAWRTAAGGVRQPLAVDGDAAFAGANDGRLVALALADGRLLWEKYIPDGVSTLAAHRGLVYVGGGDKQLYCLDGRHGGLKWPYPIRSPISGRISVDDDHVYLTALDNVVRALDRETGNMRWQFGLKRRPIGGVRVAGHIVFVQASGTEVLMLLARNGLASGSMILPGETTRETPPDVRESADGVHAVVVTGGLSNLWQLTLIGPAAELATQPFNQFTLPGLAFLTDPHMQPIARVVPWLVLGDPALTPLEFLEWPIVLRDPPLEPLTTIPGVQLRPLSPVLPVRRGA
jgi:outer membrane protein assembly factor BamB